MKGGKSSNLTNPSFHIDISGKLLATRRRLHARGTDLKTREPPSDVALFVFALIIPHIGSLGLGGWRVMMHKDPHFHGRCKAVAIDATTYGISTAGGQVVEELVQMSTSHKI